MANELIEKSKALVTRIFSSNSISDDQQRSSMIERYEQGVIADMWSKYEERKKQRHPLELEWRLNIAFYNGDQFTEIDAAWGDVHTIPAATEYEERNVFNEIAPNIETTLALMNKRRNNVKCRPASSSSEDRTAAKIGDKVIASARRNMNFPKKQKLANMYALILGSSVSKTVWDSASGRIVGYDGHVLTEDEKRAMSQDYEYESELIGRDPNILYSEIKEGDAVINILSPFEVFPENLALPCEKQKRIMHVQLLSPDEVLERWGVYEKSDDNDAFKLTNTYARNYGGIYGRVYGNTLAVEKIHNTIKVLEEWELPSGKYPMGRLVVCTKNNLLYCGSLPDKYSVSGEYKLPFDVQQSLMTDGFFGKSVIERVIPDQRALNRLKNSIADYNNRITIGVLVAPIGSLEDEDRLLSEGIAPGEIIFYRDSSHAPRFMEYPSLPPDIFREIDNLIEGINRRTGVSEFAKQSTAPGNVVAASALAGIVEQDETRVGLAVDQEKEFWISNHIKLLSLYHDNVKYKRIVRDIGKNAEFEIAQFVGSALTSFDVEIVPEPASELALAQLRQKAVELLNIGMFNDPTTGTISREARQALLEIIEFGNWEILVEEDDKHLARARRENQAMMAGEMSSIRDFDDDMIHIAAHNDIRLTAEYEELLKQKPEVDEIINAHIDEHMYNMQSKNSPGMVPEMEATPVDIPEQNSQEQFVGA